MNESATLYWKRILMTMADRNRADLSEQAYRTVLDALENKADARLLREIAVETATSLGRHGRSGSQVHLRYETLDNASRRESMSQALPIPTTGTELPALQHENRPQVKKTRRRPTARRA